jgi:nucleoside-diphosphate-sugar epimerase
MVMPSNPNPPEPATHARFGTRADVVDRFRGLFLANDCIDASGATLTHVDRSILISLLGFETTFRPGVHRMRVFVAGATGAIGKRAVRKLIAAGHAVTGVARSAASRALLEREGAGAVNLDLFDAHAVRRSMAGNEAVVNLATHIPRGLRVFWPRAWAENDRLRRDASAILGDAAAAAGARLFVQESFAFTYPDSGDEWVSEDMKLVPSKYNRTVSDAEASAHRFSHAGGRGVVLRFAALYGPADVFTDQLLAAVRHGVLPIFGRAEGYLPMVHHDDAASAVLTALEASAGAYNVVDDLPLCRSDLAAVMADLQAVRRPRLPPAWMSSLAGPAGEAMSRSIRLSNRKLRSLGWVPAYPSAREGLQSIVAETHMRRSADHPEANAVDGSAKHLL